MPAGKISPSAIRTVVFDLGGVLVRWNDEYLYRAVAQSLHVSPRDAKKKLDPILLSLTRGQSSTSKAEMSLGLKKGFFTEVFARHARPNSCALHLAVELRKYGYSIGILSNTIESHAVHSAKQGWFDRFDHVFLSYEIGVLKPSREIFKIMLGKLSLQPNNVLFVDDSPENTRAASNFGIASITYTNCESLEARLHRLTERKLPSHVS